MSALGGNVRRMTVKPALLDWMLETDPALRWQVERDLMGEPEAVWEATRARVATEGLGARLLALQDADGNGRVAPSSRRGSPARVRASRGPRRRRR